MSEATVVPTEQKTSLLEGLKAAEKPAKNDLTSQPSWHIMEGLPGTGDKPEWLLPKYGSMADQAKAYTELEKKFGAREVAPEKYDFGSQKDALDLENQHIQEFVHFAKQKNLSQEIVATTVDKFANYLKSKEPDFNKELEKIGSDANTKIETIRLWAENNFSQESLDAFGTLPKTASTIKLLDEIRQRDFHNTTNVPANNDPGIPFVKLSKKEVEDEMFTNREKFYTDENYRKEITKKFEQVEG